MKIRTSEKVWKEIGAILKLSFTKGVDNVEWGIIGVIESAGKEARLIRKVFQPGPDDLDQSHGGLVFSSCYIRRVQLYSQQNNGCGLIFFHTHPFSDDRVSFSCYDDAEEPLLIKNLRDVWPNSEYMSIVAGRNSYKGRY